jgi:hypothetical protein
LDCVFQQAEDVTPPPCVKMEPDNKDQAETIFQLGSFDNMSFCDMLNKDIFGVSYCCFVVWIVL